MDGSVVVVSVASNNTWFLGPIRVHNSSGIWIGSAVFVVLTIMYDRQTT